METIGNLFGFVHETLVLVLVGLVTLGIVVIAVLFKVFQNDFSQD
ncbi:MAG: hypothetical protein QG625_3430 [Cyanobacteriota bacterium erpe_2018_sw_39hr_WHONDRS-SW48-000098_B_bin.30]|jgi:hypothetical protein|nr:hypothetical protein [Cyanobacteriota bacterium erpe_2018_sw_39hr_WHONDRS-SW48-000098_B_bin.30]